MGTLIDEIAEFRGLGGRRLDSGDVQGRSAWCEVVGSGLGDVFVGELRGSMRTERPPAFEGCGERVGSHRIARGLDC